MPDVLPQTRYAYIYQLGDDLNGDKQFQHLVTMDVPIGFLADARVTKYGLTLKYGKLLYRLPLPGELGDKIYENAIKLPYKWKSKKFVMPGQTAIGAGKVVRDCGGSCKMILFIDCCKVWETEICDSKPFTVPMHLVGINFEIQLEGTARVRKVQLAASINELMEVQ